MIVFDDEHELAQRYWDLLAPIAGDSPAGVRLWSTSDRDWPKLREAWVANYTERIPEEGALAESPTWETVKELASQLLKTLSKDLQVAIWLAYAMVRDSGLTKLAEGLFLIRQLIARFENQGLFPDDPEERLELLGWFDAQLAGALLATPITPALDGVVFSCAEYESLTRPVNRTILSADPEEAASRARAARLSDEGFLQSNRRFFANLSLQAQSGRIQLDRLASFPLSIGALDRCQTLLARWTRFEGLPPEPPPPPKPVAPQLNDDDLLEKYERLLGPIADDNPIGVRIWSISDPDWEDLRKARIGFRGGLISPSAGPLELPNWREVARLSGRLLERRTKDLQIAMWLTQALLEEKSLDGLSDGLFLIHELIDRFWGWGMFPEENDDRCELFDWFDRELSDALLATPLSPSANGVRYSYLDYQWAAAVLRRQPARPDLTPEERERARETRLALLGVDRDEYQKLSTAAQAATARLKRLASQLEGLEIPNLDRSRESLTRVRQALSAWERGDIPADEPDPEIPDPDTIAGNWERALAWVRLDRADKAASLVERTLTSLPVERDRFLRKLELAEALMAARRHDRARGILESLDQQVDRFHLRDWEDPALVGRVWSALLGCYRESAGHDAQARAIEVKIGGWMPWRSLI